MNGGETARLTRISPRRSRARRISYAPRSGAIWTTRWRESLGLRLGFLDWLQRDGLCTKHVLGLIRRGVRWWKRRYGRNGSLSRSRNAFVPSCRPCQRVRALLGRGGQLSPGSGEGQSRRKAAPMSVGQEREEVSNQRGSLPGPDGSSYTPGSPPPLRQLARKRFISKVVCCLRMK